MASEIRVCKGESVGIRRRIKDSPNYQMSQAPTEYEIVSEIEFEMPSESLYNSRFQLQVPGEYPIGTKFQFKIEAL